GTFTSAYGFHNQSGGVGATSYAAFCSQAQSSATNNTYILLGTGTIPSGNWGIYSTVTSDSRLANTLQLVASTTTTTTLGQKNSRLLLINNSSTANAGAEVVLGATGDTDTGRYCSIGVDIKNNSSTAATGDFYVAT